MVDLDKMIELFAAASDLPVEQRTAFLASQCGGNPEMLAQLQSLLASHTIAEGKGFLRETALNEVARQAALDATFDNPIGELFGRYRIIRLLGEGGMGEVYLAEDTGLHRNVALKMINSAIPSSELLDRFAREARILAHLNHENIAQILDAGTSATGVPFLVMEYVDGKPITQHCDLNRLPVAKRLELFRVVCSAVQYAHQNVVVHRDLKPSNILVTAEGQVKLLDFGIARLLDSPVSSDAPGALLAICTPKYASPEQIKGEVTTTAADVYSLGVVLYELLTGSQLYSLERRTTSEILTAVCQQEARLPSSVIGAPAVSPVAEIEGGAEKLSRRLRGDLDHIVLKALRKDPQARYPTVEQFSDDIARHMECVPVLARRRTFGDRASKFMRRNRIAVSAAAVVLLVLIAGIVVTSWEARVAIAQRSEAQKRFEQARRLAHTLLFDYHDAIATLPGSTPIRQRLVTDALTYLNGLSRDSAGDVDLQLEVAAAYLRVGDVQGRPYTANLGQTAPALVSYRKALEISQSILAVKPKNDQAQRQLATAYERIGSIEGREHRFVEGLAAQRRSIAIRQHLATAHPTDPGIRRELAASHLYLGDALQATCSLGKWENCMREALDVQRQGLAIVQALARENPGDLELRRNMAQFYMRIGFRLRDLGLGLHDNALLPQDLASQQQAMQLRVEVAAADPSNARDRRNVADQRMLLSDAQVLIGDLSSAIAGYQQSVATFTALSLADPANAEARRDLSFAHIKLAEAMTREGNDAAALEHYLASFDCLKQLLADDPASAEDRQDIAKVYREISEAYESLHNYPQAVEYYRDHLNVVPPDGFLLCRFGHLNLLAAQAKSTLASRRPAYWKSAREAFTASMDYIDHHPGGAAAFSETYKIASREGALAAAALAGRH